MTVMLPKSAADGHIVVSARDEGLFAYGFHIAGGQRRAANELLLPWTAFRDLILSGASRAGAALLRILPSDLELDDAMLTLEHEEARLRAEASELVRRCEDMLANLEDGGSGEPSLFGDARRDFSARYNAAAAERDKALAAVEDVARRRSTRRYELLERQHSVHAERLLSLIGRLSDPHSCEDRALWFQAIREIEIDAEAIEGFGRGARLISMRGVLALGDDAHDTYALDLNHRFVLLRDVRKSTNLEQAKHLAIADLEAGTPYLAADIPWRKSLMRHVAAELGVPSRSFLLSTCRDGRIARCAMAAVYRRRGRTDAEIAAELGEELGFVRRIADVYRAPQSSRWLRQRSLTLTRLRIAAATNAGIVDGNVLAAAGPSVSRAAIAIRDNESNLWTGQPGGWTLTTSCGCGPRAALALMRCPEPVGDVCLNCRRDRSGLIWPSEYDQYIAFRELWADAGFVAAQQPDESHSRPRFEVVPAPARAAHPFSRAPAIREWGRANGFDVLRKGRLTRDVVDAYLAAHPEATARPTAPPTAPHCGR